MFVIPSPLLGVAKNVVSSLNELEFNFGLLHVVQVFIGVPLKCHLSVGFLQFIITCILRNPQHFVVALHPVKTKQLQLLNRFYTYKQLQFK